MKTQNEKTQTEEPIRLSSFRRDARRTRSGAMERQMRLSFALVALLLAASATIGLTHVKSDPPAQGTAAQSVIASGSSRG